MKQIFFTTMLLVCIVHHAALAQHASLQTLNQYKEYLIQYTGAGQTWPEGKPKSRYETLKRAFQEFEDNNMSTVVELGTTRSFVHGGIEGCLSDDTQYWTPENPANWDWGAGCFTRVVSECLAHTKPNIHTVDIERTHINRCKVVTKEFSHFIEYYVTSSEEFLQQCNFKVDLLYLDTGYLPPDEGMAQLHLREAKIIVERDLIAPGGLILIDDVRCQVQRSINGMSEYGKATLSLPYFLAHGFEIIEDGFQVLLRKKKSPQKNVLSKLKSIFKRNK